MARMTRWIAGSTAGLALAALAFAEEAPEGLEMEGPLRETVEVQLLEHEKPKHPTLQFLHENRVFFRAQLDHLLMTTRLERDGSASLLDERYLRFQAMLDEIRAARDSAEVSQEWIRRRELMESVGELVELELEMDEMEELLQQQRDRLIWLEEDFVGRQETALIVLLTGVPSGGAPATIVLEDDTGERVRVAIGPEERDSLLRGGTTELFHELVEPRLHVWKLSIEDPAWTGRAPWEIPLEPERDRLTFLEVDLTGMDPAAPSNPITKSWVR